MIGVVVFFLIIIIVLLVIIARKGGKKKEEETEELPREPDQPPAEEEEEETLEIREETLSEGPVELAETDPMPTFFEDRKEIATGLFNGINEDFKEGIALGIDVGNYRGEYENAIASFKAGDFDSAVEMFGAIRDRLGREMEAKRNPMLGQGDKLEDLFALPGHEE